jgi:hypothetical protein
MKAFPRQICALALSAVLLFFSSHPVDGQSQGAILLFSDSTYTDCHLEDSGSRNHTVYVVHVDDVGAVASEFTILNDGATGLSYLGETVPWPVAIGNSQTGLSVSYEMCLSGSILVCSIEFLGDGTSPTCSSLRPVGPSLGIPVGSVDCSYFKAYPVEGRLVVNPDGTCPCGPPVPVESTTWGRVKALYR